MPVRLVSSSSDNESPWERGPYPKRRKVVVSHSTTEDVDLCDGENEFGCSTGSENCKDKYLCE
jgi:hypothetical protein